MNIRFVALLIINIVLTVLFAYIGYTNFKLILLHNPTISHSELFYLLISVIALSMCFGMYLIKLANIKRNKKIAEYQRELERRGIDRDESSSKVKVLESKIEVLEKALQDAIKNKNN